MSYGDSGYTLMQCLTAQLGRARFQTLEPERKQKAANSDAISLLSSEGQLVSDVDSIRNDAVRVVVRCRHLPYSYSFFSTPGKLERALEI